jgi:hypothetical protein
LPVLWGAEAEVDEEDVAAVAWVCVSCTVAVVLACVTRVCVLVVVVSSSGVLVFIPVGTIELLAAALKLPPGGASGMSVLMHTILPTWTVFVDK